MKATLPARKGLALTGLTTRFWRSFISLLLRRFVGSLIFLVCMILFADLFSALWRFLALDAPLSSILAWLAYGAPEYFMDMLPVSMLFSTTLALAESYTNGELIVVFGSGTSVRKFTLPAVVLALILAVAIPVFDDAVAVPASSARELVYQKLVGIGSKNLNSQDITIISGKGRWVYEAGSFDPKAKRLLSISILRFDKSGEPDMRLLAPSALWNGSNWVFESPRIVFRSDAGSWTERDLPLWNNREINEPPASFAQVKSDVHLMTSKELKVHIQFLKSAGLPAEDAETELLKRFSFALTPLVVCGLSIAAGGLFKKNAFLMSLVLSLSTATVYYVAQMLGSIAARAGTIEPKIGVFAGTTVLAVLATLGYFRART